MQGVTPPVPTSVTSCKGNRNFPAHLTVRVSGAKRRRVVADGRHQQTHRRIRTSARTISHKGVQHALSLRAPTPTRQPGRALRILNRNEFAVMCPRGRTPARCRAKCVRFVPTTRLAVPEWATHRRNGLNGLSSCRPGNRPQNVRQKGISSASDSAATNGWPPLGPACLSPQARFRHELDGNLISANGGGRFFLTGTNR